MSLSGALTVIFLSYNKWLSSFWLSSNFWSYPESNYYSYTNTFIIIQNIPAYIARRHLAERTEPPEGATQVQAGQDQAKPDPPYSDRGLK